MLSVSNITHGPTPDRVYHTSRMRIGSVYGKMEQLTRLDLSLGELGTKHISLIYENTVKGCSLRRFAAERAISQGLVKDLVVTEADVTELPPAFRFDLIMLFNDLKDGKTKAIKANGWKYQACTCSSDRRDKNDGSGEVEPAS